MDKCASCVDNGVGRFDNVVEGGGVMEICCSDDESSSSSSIGKNSDLSENSLQESGDGEEEVQSSYKSPLDSVGALQDVSPIRRGMSSFYNGKSKSFASLADASSSSSIKDLAKPENAYNKKRRNLVAHKIAWDKTRSSSLRSNGGSISKRVTSSSRSSFALAVAMNNFDNDKRTAERDSPMKDLCYWRSFSLADLQH